MFQSALNPYGAYAFKGLRNMEDESVVLILFWEHKIYTWSDFYPAKDMLEA